MSNIDEIIEALQLAIAQVERDYPMEYYTAAFDALKKQKELAEYSGCDICEWDPFGYESVACVDDFLINEVKGKNNERE